MTTNETPKKAAKAATAKTAAPKAVKKAVAKPTKKTLTGRRFKLTQHRGFSGMSETQRRTMAALNLRGRHRSVEVADNPANRGQIMKVQHLITVEVLG